MIYFQCLMALGSKHLLLGYTVFLCTKISEVYDAWRHQWAVVSTLLLTSLLNTSGLTWKRHAQAVGQANSNQPNIPNHLNQANILTHLGQPNYPCIFWQVLSILIEPLRTHIRCGISVLPQTWWSPAVGWITTNVL